MSGPSREFLRNLRGMLPSFVAGMKEKSTIGRGIKAPTRRIATKVCTVCTKLYDFQDVPTGKEPALAIKRCPECDAVLKDGFVAVVSVNKLCFVKHPSLADLAGTTVRVTPEHFQMIQAKHNVDVKERQNGQDSDGSTDTGNAG